MGAAQHRLESGAAIGRSWGPARPLERRVWPRGRAMLTTRRGLHQLLGDAQLLHRGLTRLNHRGHPVSKTAPSPASPHAHARQRISCRRSKGGTGVVWEWCGQPLLDATNSLVSSIPPQPLGFHRVRVAASALHWQNAVAKLNRQTALTPHIGAVPTRTRVQPSPKYRGVLLVR